MELSDWLRARRGLTGQRGLVAAARLVDPGCGIHQATVSAWESGRSVPSLRQLLAVSAALELSPAATAEGEALWRLTQIAPETVA